MLAATGPTSSSILLFAMLGVLLLAGLVGLMAVTMRLRRSMLGDRPIERDEDQQAPADAWAEAGRRASESGNRGPGGNRGPRSR